VIFYTFLYVDDKFDHTILLNDFISVNQTCFYHTLFCMSCNSAASGKTIESLTLDQLVYLLVFNCEEACVLGFVSVRCPSSGQCWMLHHGTQQRRYIHT